MHYWRLLVFSSTLTYECGKSVSVSYTRRLLNGTRDIVVSVAKFVSQQLNLVRGRSNCVIDDGEASRRSHSLTCSHRHQIELICVFVCHSRVNDGTGLRILEAAWITSKDSRIHSFASIDVHQLTRVLESLLGKSLLNLLNLW